MQKDIPKNPLTADILLSMLRPKESPTGPLTQGKGRTRGVELASKQEVVAKRRPIVWEPTLDEAERRWADLAASLTATEFAPRAAELDREQRYARENAAQLRKAGIDRMFLPTSVGGGGASLTAYVAVVEAIARGCASTSGIVATLQLGAYPLLLTRNEALRRRHLGAVAREGQSVSFALSEREAGSDPSGMTTTAVREGAGWRIRGEKCWIGSGGVASKYVVFAQTEPGAGRKGIAAFLVEADAEGVDDDEFEDKMGMRGTTTATIRFDTWVDEDSVVAPPGEGLKVALQGLNIGRIGVAAQSCGIGFAAYEAAVGRAVGRQTFGKLLIEHQAIGFRLADLATWLSAARMLAYEAAAAYDRGEDVAVIGAQAKLFASETAHEAVDTAVQVFGGAGYVKPNLVERLYRDQRVTEIYEGTSEIQRLVLARAIRQAAEEA